MEFSRDKLQGGCVRVRHFFSDCFLGRIFKWLGGGGVAVPIGHSTVRCIFDTNFVNKTLRGTNFYFVDTKIENSEEERLIENITLSF